MSVLDEAIVDEIGGAILRVFREHRTDDRDTLQGEIIRAVIDVLERIEGQKLLQRT